MNEIIINSISEIDSAMENFGRGSLCRGVSNETYELKPSLFRDDKYDNDKYVENHLTFLFKTTGKAFLNKTPENDLEWLVIAQHHGLPTRLLDWSLSPLVACYFAVRTLSKNNGAIYIFDCNKFIKEEDIDLNKLEGIKAFIPSHVSPRVTAQLGHFTIHSDEEKEMNNEEITKLIIPAEKKGIIFERLVKFGVHHNTMYPDLDGLANHLKFLHGY